MTTQKLSRTRVLAPGLLLAMTWAASLVWLEARQAPVGAAVSVDGDDIGGVVQGEKGPEAGVWVIAETTALPTKFAKVVVTDEQGRFVLPDLPKASYRVWVRGYGLVDSQPVEAMPGKVVTLRATTARTPQEAAKIYPSNYWYSLIKVPPRSEFPGTGPTGNGIAVGLTQAQWVDNMKQGCQLCHQLGNKVTREPRVSAGPTAAASATPGDGPGAVGTAGAEGPNPASLAAWDRRVQAGQRGADMSRVMSRFGRRRGLEMFADWTDRIAAGEVPPPPPRPAGVERNLVLTLWDVSHATALIHDEIATDRRNPTVNAYGPVYGTVITHDELMVTDPVAHTTRGIKVPLRPDVDPQTVPPLYAQTILLPSIHYGNEILWTNPAAPHNPMMDGKGRVWVTQGLRRPDDVPAWCKGGGEHPSVKNFPVEQGGRWQASVYDPKTNKFTLIDTCFGTHHLQFAEDKNDTLWFSGDQNVIGWINTKRFDETQDAAGSQGWCPMILDTNGDGAIGQVRATRSAGQSGAGHADHGVRLRPHYEPGGRVGVDGADGTGAGPDCAARSGQQPAGHLQDRSV